MKNSYAWPNNPENHEDYTVNLEDVRGVIATYNESSALTISDQTLNDMVETGSIDLRCRDIDDETMASVMQARQAFFGEVLGWDDESHPSHSSYIRLRDENLRVMPIDTFVRTQSALTELGLDATKIVNTFSQAIGYSIETVRAKIANLAELGLDPVKVVNMHPVIIGYSIETVRAKMDNLAELGLDAIKVVNMHPVIIGYSIEAVRAKMDNLTELGLDATKIMNTFPQAIGCSIENVRTKIQCLIDLNIIQSSQDLKLISSNDISSLFVTPLESWVTYLAQADPVDVDPVKIGYKARSYMKTLGVSKTTERKKYYLEHLPAIYSSLGEIAIKHAIYIKLPKGGIELAGQYAE